MSVHLSVIVSSWIIWQIFMKFGIEILYNKNVKQAWVS